MLLKVLARRDCDMSGVRKEFYLVNIVLEMPDDLNEGDTVLSFA